jgi:hypothetical protein
MIWSSSSWQTCEFNLRRRKASERRRKRRRKKSKRKLKFQAGKISKKYHLLIKLDILLTLGFSKNLCLPTSKTSSDSPTSLDIRRKCQANSCLIPATLMSDKFSLNLLPCLWAHSMSNLNSINCITSSFLDHMGLAKLSLFEH